jgi:Protein of unknown function (DUF3551)
MHKTTIVAATFLAAALGCILADQASAYEYPYCAMRGGRGSSENCGYASLAQCRATVQGAGGYCQPNPRFFAAYREADGYGSGWRRHRPY